MKRNRKWWMIGVIAFIAVVAVYAVTESGLGTNPSGSVGLQAQSTPLPSHGTGRVTMIDLGATGVQACSMSGGGGLMARLRVRGIGGAFFLGLAYGVLSGSCTFGFIAPILAIITIQQKIATGILFIVLFGIGHCIPIAVAGSSTALVQRLLENSRFQSGGQWFRRAAGVTIAGLGVYFILRPFLGDVA